MKKLWVLAVVALGWLVGAAGQAGADAPVHNLGGELGILAPGDTQGTTVRIDEPLVNRAVSVEVMGPGDPPWRPVGDTWTNLGRPTVNSQFASFNLSPVQTANRVDFGYALGVGGENNAGDFGGAAIVGRHDDWGSDSWDRTLSSENHFQLSKGPGYNGTDPIELRVLVAGGGSTWNAVDQNFTSGENPFLATTDLQGDVSVTDGSGNLLLSTSPTMDFATELRDDNDNLSVVAILGEGNWANTTYFPPGQIPGWEDFQTAWTEYTMNREFAFVVDPFSEPTLDLLVKTEGGAMSEWVNTPEDYGYYSLSDYGDAFSVSVTSPTPGISVRLVPEPSSLGVVFLWGTFCAGVGWWRRRRMEDPSC